MSELREASCNDLDFTAAANLRDVLSSEHDEIERRRKVDGEGVYPDPKEGDERPRDLAAVALSGGGIRSATFNLGILQALHDSGLLRRFDYLSTCSGGAYVGGWWSAWLARRTEDSEKDIFPPPEKLETERHEMRLQHQYEEGAKSGFKYEHEDIGDSAMSAGGDPVHHLRLFGHYLTPRVGLFSSDTWRAIAIVSRNLVLTWMILLPILLAGVMAAQAYFALIPATSGAFIQPNVGDVAGPMDSAAAVGHLAKRLIWALLPSAILFAITILAGAFWAIAATRITTKGDVLAVCLSGVVLIVLTYMMGGVIGRRTDLPSLGMLGAGIAGAFVITAVVIGFTQLMQRRGDPDAWRNKLTRIHTWALSTSVILAGVLLFAGFGHEIVAFLLNNSELKHAVTDYVARTGGWTMVTMTLGGTIFSAMRAAPSGGAEPGKPSRTTSLIMSIVPPMLVLVLAAAAAGFGHYLYRSVANVPNPTPLRLLMVASIAAAALFLGLALYEFRPLYVGPMQGLFATWAVILGIVFAFRHLLTIDIALAVAAATVVGLILRAVLRTRQREWHWGYVAFPIAAFAAVKWFVPERPPFAQWVMPAHYSFVLATLVTGLLFCASLLLFELGYGRGANRRSFAMQTLATVTLSMLCLAPYLPGRMEVSALTSLGLVIGTIGWVVALGWLADPNALSGHLFYKSRLVRAYLGASNPNRAYDPESPDARKGVEVTDAVPGDDLPLTALRNCEKGAPYHLIASTLNLVAAGDLGTAQRSSDYFLMSKNYCGSMRTGYRKTSEYMCGTMSLGTAVAISGAAASPNMGGNTPSASNVALMTLLNIRLGYWLPTPNRSYWRASMVRLWPWYTLQELLSQTNDLMPYCYLTDGGHFDNSSLYPLLERGTRFILFTDCGFDTQPSFGDLGAVARRARIDFGTEVDIDVSKLLPLGADNAPAAHFTVGRIRYSERHAKALGWNKDEPREGVIVAIKPNRAPGASIDVREYGWSNANFPQTPTSDQSYDEAQFESYRKLGHLSVELLCKAIPSGVTDIAKWFASAFTTLAPEGVQEKPKPLAEYYLPIKAAPPKPSTLQL